MSRKFLVSIDLNKNELQNAKIQNLATAPSSPVAGQIYYNTTSNSLFFYNGTTWVDTVQSGSIIYGTFAARPAAGTAGRLYFATDQQLLYFDDGATWAQVSNFGTITAQTSYGASSGNGSSNNYARADHTHGTPSLTSNAPTNIAVGASAAVGTGTAPARDDHTHGMAAFGTVSAQTSYGSSSGNGSATTIARSDHTHGTPALTSVTPSTQAIGDAAVVGTGTAPAREDHKHAMPSFGAVTAQTTFGASSGNGSGTSIARNDHTHGTPTHDNAAHSAINLSALAVPLTAVSFNSQKITSLGTPTASTDAATKQYVDDVAQGLHVHESCVAATTANLTATYNNGSSGVGATLTNSGTLAAFAVDGVSPAINARVLVKNQTTQTQNGIYTLTTVGSGAVAWVLTRATDFNESVEIDGGDFVFVTGGTTNNDTGWVQTETAVVIGTNNIIFTQFSGAGTYTASGGITLTGNNFAISNANVGTWATTPSSANLAAAVTDETGSGSLVFATSPTLVTPNIGVATGTSFNSITALSSTTPNANGTAAVGTATTVARADHTHPISALTLGTGLTGTSYNGSSAVTAAIDTSVVVRKFAASVGDGTSTSITVTHNLGTRDVQVTLYDNSAPYAELICDVEHATTNTVTLGFSVAPTSNQYRAVVFG